MKACLSSWACATLAAGAILAACSVDVELAGKECPCVADYECDRATNRCVVRTRLASIDASPTDATPPQASTLLQLADFRAKWTTANGALFTWSANGNKDDFGRYELVVADSEATLATGGGARFTSATNPELGRFVLPRTGSPEDFVRSTFVDGLKPATEYVARLVAVDRTGAEARPATALATTTVTRSDATLFDEADPAWTAPACVAASSSAPHAGARHLAVEVMCAANSEQACTASTASACWATIQLGFAADFSAMTAGSFTDAFLEFALAVDGGDHVYWGAAIFNGSRGAFSVQPLTYRADGRYRVYQVRLSAFTNASGAAATFDDLKSFDSIAVGGELPVGHVLRLDAVRVRW